MVAAYLSPMAVRPPRDLRLENGASVLDYELLGEKAATLGRVGERAGAAIRRLEACAPDAADRPALVAAAAEAVWHFFIQRELCGFRDHRGVIAEMRIPRAVLSRLGAGGRR
jgi:hypothetical protein